MNKLAKTACAVSMIALATAAGAAEACWTPKELAAARIRDVQTIMMVGALQCSAQGYNTAFGYDRFVTRHRAGLVEANDVLKRHFMRQTVSSTGQRDYDAFATALANGHSAESSDMRNYCERVDSLVRTAVSLHGDELAGFAADVSERPLGVGEDCGRAVIAENDALPPPRIRDEDVERPQQVAVAVTVTTPPAVEPVAAPVEVAVAVPAPAPEPLPAPVEVAVAMPAKAPAPVQSAAVDDGADVRQATAALQKATEALQAAIAAQQARPVVSQVSMPSNPPTSAGPRGASVAPVVLAPEPVVAPADVLRFVG